MLMEKMAEEKETEDKLGQLQLIEQNMQSFMLQRQNLQMQLMEIESALAEIVKTDSAYKIVGSIIVSVKKDDLKKELDGKKDVLNLRMRSIEKQEEKLREKASKMQADVLKGMESRR